MLRRDEATASRLLDVVLPWRAARTVYGPYGVADALKRIRRG